MALSSWDELSAYSDILNQFWFAGNDIIWMLLSYFLFATIPVHFLYSYDHTVKTRYCRVQYTTILLAATYAVTWINHIEKWTPQNIKHSALTLLHSRLLVVDWGLWRNTVKSLTDIERDSIHLAPGLIILTWVWNLLISSSTFTSSLVLLSVWSVWLQFTQGMTRDLIALVLNNNCGKQPVLNCRVPAQPTMELKMKSYQMRKSVVCACAGNAGNVFLATDFKGNR